MEHVPFALKIIFFLKNVLALVGNRRKHHNQSFCWLSFRYHCHYYTNVQGGSDKSGIFFFLLSNDTAQLKIIGFD
jgi:hypothetical protein